MILPIFHVSLLDLRMLIADFKPFAVGSFSSAEMEGCSAGPVISLAGSSFSTVKKGSSTGAGIFFYSAGIWKRNSTTENLYPV